MTDLAKLVVRLEAETSQYQAKLEQAQRQLGTFQKSASGDFQKIAAGLIGLGVGAAIGFVALTKSAIDAADGMNDLSKQTGISTESLSQLKFAAEQSGTNLDEVTLGLKKISSAAAAAQKDVGGTAAKAFARLGIDVETANHELKSSEDLLLDTAEMFSQYADGAGKSAIATELFGKAGTRLIPFLNEGRKGIEALKAEAARLGITLSGDTAQAADDFNDELNKVKATVAGLGTQAATQLLPVLNDVLSAFTETAGGSDALRAASAGLGFALKLIVDIGYTVYRTFADIGGALGALAAAAVQAAKGNFAQAWDILKTANEDQLRDEAEANEFFRKLWSERGDDLEAYVVRAKKFKKQLSFAIADPLAGLEEVDTKARKIDTDPMEAFYDALDQRTRSSTENILASYYQQEVALNELWDAGRLGIEQYDERLMESLDTALPEIKTSVKKIKVEVEKTIDQITEFEKRAAENTQDIIADTLDNSFKDGFSGIVQDFGEMLRKLANQAIAANIAKYIFGTPGQSGDTGGVLGSLLGSVAGAFAGARAGGGPVRSGSAYVVGEEGPEVFVPDTSGNIVANGGGAVHLTQNFYYDAPRGTVSRQTQMQTGADAARGISLANRRNN